MLLEERKGEREEGHEIPRAADLASFMSMVDGALHIIVRDKRDSRELNESKG